MPSFLINCSTAVLVKSASLRTMLKKSRPVVKTVYGDQLEFSLSPAPLWTDALATRNTWVRKGIRLSKDIPSWKTLRATSANIS